MTRLLLIPLGDEYVFEDLATGTRVRPEDAIRHGFIVGAAEAKAALAMIDAGLARTPGNNLHANAWERIREEGAK